MLVLITNIASSVSITGRSLAHHSLEVSAVSRTSLSLPALPVRLIPDFETSSPSYSLGAVGGTESLGITAGETKNPGKNMPRVVKFVFWRCVCFLRKLFCVSAHCILQHHVILHLEHLINRFEWCAYSRTTLYIILPNLRPFSSVGLPKSF